MGNYQPLVSVIVPVYNVAPFLNDCLDSIINQTYQNLEIIIVNDGSTDNSLEICKTYRDIEPRITLISQENKGLSGARNTGIACANGLYYTFVDSDDFLLPDMIEKLVVLLDTYNCEIAQCSAVRCKETEKASDISVENNNSCELLYLSPEEAMYAYLVNKTIETTAWAKIYHNRLFEDLIFPIGKYHEDVFTTYLLIEKAKGIVVSSISGYVYRENGNSITTQHYSRHRLDAILGKIEMFNYIEEKYSELKNYAGVEVVYACNLNLLQLSRSNIRDDDITQYLQRIYRKYGIYYLKSDKSILKKAMVLGAMANVNVIRVLINLGKVI